MKSNLRMLAAFSVAIAAVAAFALFSADLARAGVGIKAVSLGGHDIVSQIFTASPALLALRSEHADLVSRATAKLAEIKPNLAADVVARMESDHADLVRQAAAKKVEIEAEERRIASAPPAPSTDVSTAVAAERTRIADINSIGARAGMTAESITAAISGGQTVEAFRAAAFDHMASAADATRTRVDVTRDETQTRMEHMTDALTVRIGGASSLRNAETGAVRPLSTEARAFIDHSFAEMSAIVLGERSMPRTAGAREDVIRRAMHTTSDFPIIFEASINRVLAARYQVQEPTYRRIAARRQFNDFRPHDQIRVGDFPMLQPVGQSGEIKFGSFGESKETIAVAPYAVQFALTRQMLVNDNIGAIDQVLGSYGDSVARFEEATFYAMKAANAGLGPTLIEGNVSVFHAAKHFNLAAAGTAITTDALSAGRAAMRKQKNQSGAVLNLRPSILFVGADQETAADKAVAVITPTEAGDVNPFSKKLEVLCGPVDGNAWELYADPSVSPVFVWGMLEGYTAPRMRIENPFGVQGVGVSLEHDFGVGAIDFRGGYRNPGQA